MAEFPRIRHSGLQNTRVSMSLKMEQEQSREEFWEVWDNATLKACLSKQAPEVERIKRYELRNKLRRKYTHVQYWYISSNLACPHRILHDVFFKPSVSQ